MTDAAPCTMLAAALDAYDAGLCVIRTSVNGSKKPLPVPGYGKAGPDGGRGAGWELFQSERPTREQVEAWFAGGHAGMGMVCGAVSGDYEMLELEGRFVNEGGTGRFTEAMKAAGLELLLKRLITGYMAASPSGGRHLHYRVSGPVDGNTKLASRPLTDAERLEHPSANAMTLIETRGEGGFVVLAPSHGTTHPSGEAWKVRAGSVATIPTITPDERDTLHAVARTFDDTPTVRNVPVAPSQRATHAPYVGDVGESWFDSVERHLEASWSMVGLLEHYGWTYCYDDRHGRKLMRRPGKDADVSGSINTSDRLCVFSTSTPFPAPGGKNAPTFNRLDVIAMYEYGNDRQGAARAIAEQTGILAAWQRAQDTDKAALFAPRPPPGVDPVTGEVVGTTSSILGEEFWTAREALVVIRQAARSRLVSPTAVLGCVLARVAAFTPPSTCLPATIGSRAPLSLYVALRGRSGAGKSSPAATADDLMPVIPPGCAGPLTIGTGEGLVEAYMKTVEETDGGGKKQKVKRQVLHGVLFSLDEGQMLGEIAARKGATILPVLRTAWSGGDPGQANASIETRRSLRSGTYALGLISLWQDKAATVLLADVDGGTPQRFVWMPTDDPDATTTPPAWPGELNWQAPTAIVMNGVMGRNELTVDPTIIAEIVAARVAELRNETQHEPLDAHRRLNKLKVAGVLAVLDGRHDISTDDWSLAEMIMRQSDAVRDWVLAEARRRQASLVEAEGARLAAREAIVEGSAASRALASSARNAYRAVLRGDGSPVGRRVIHAAIPGRDRQHVSTDEAIAEAERLHWIIGNQDAGWRCGSAKPT